MASRFVRKKGLISAKLSADEAMLVANLVSQVIELLRDDENTRSGSADDDLAKLVGGFGSTIAPTDPVVARLLPDGYRGDEEAAGEFRRFTEVGLRSAKLTAAEQVLADLGVFDEDDDVDDADVDDAEVDDGSDDADKRSAGKADQVKVSLDADGALTWARCLNDLRLSIGTRLEVSDDDSDDRFAVLDPDDPVRWTYEVYIWIGWLQESLIEAMAQTLPEPHRD